MSTKVLKTRDRVLESAWTLLLGNQANAVRISDIAKHAGISRQAVYLHFPTRAELLIATTRYIDQVKGIDERLAHSRSASTGVERLAAFIDAWGNYIPEIYGVAKALMAMQAQDPEAGQAWADRMNAVREGCEAAVSALVRDGVLTQSLSHTEAVDLLWSQLSVEHWAHLRHHCGWTQARYIAVLQHTLLGTLVD